LKAKSAAKSKAGLSNTSASPSNTSARPSNTTPRTSRGKAIKSAASTSYSKTIPSTSYKTPAPKKKKVHYSRQINKNNYLYLLTIKAKRNRTFLYKKRQGIRRLKPRGIRL
jgi:hypothetical protein